MPTREQRHEHLVAEVATRLTSAAATGLWSPVRDAHAKVFDPAWPMSENYAVWFDGFQRFARNQHPCPPSPVPWWRRIWSTLFRPSPDDRPGGMWR